MAIQAFTVSQLTDQIKMALEEMFPAVWVRGEISDLARPRSGHLYFTLKDESSQIRAVIWRGIAERLAFELKDGMEVIIGGQVEVYGPRGTYQLVGRAVEAAGVGALELAFRQLRSKLAAEGLFDQERKKPIPAFPKRIGFVTSPSGAAIGDFLEVAKRRFQGVTVVLIPAKVQGEGAAKEIVQGIRDAHRIRPRLDVLVVGRGGGSLEDLWCFNEEAVVRAIAGSRIPTVSAVGHEIDVTLSDLVADERALTPSQAAERLVPSAEAMGQQLGNLQQRLVLPLRRRMEQYQRTLLMWGDRPCLRRPIESLQQRQRTVDDWDLRMQRASAKLLERFQSLVVQRAAAIEALSPLAVIARGYSITSRQGDGRPIVSVRGLRPGTRIETRLSDGTIISQIVAPS
jgi:exodeoxyribonuclease VII large subunit